MGYRFVAEIEILGESPAAQTPPVMLVSSNGSQPQTPEAAARQPAAVLMTSDSAPDGMLASASALGGIPRSSGPYWPQDALAARGTERPEDRLCPVVVAETPESFCGTSSHMPERVFKKFHDDCQADISTLFDHDSLAIPDFEKARRGGRLSGPAFPLGSGLFAGDGCFQQLRSHR
jgi:hypothetical protein